MTLRPEDWPRLKEVFEGARALQAEARPAYVAAACGCDEGLRNEVETLLASHEYAKNFLETPAVLSRLESGSSLTFTQWTPGSQLGSYQILNLLGTGGMGQVYRAFDPRLRREVAIKVAAERFSERFDREVRAVAALNHPNICTLHDVGANYLVMELIDGASPKG